jgi:hypothetical protein
MLQSARVADRTDAQARKYVVNKICRAGNAELFLADMGDFCMRKIEHEAVHKTGYPVLEPRTLRRVDAFKTGRFQWYEQMVSVGTTGARKAWKDLRSTDLYTMGNIRLTAGKTLTDKGQRYVWIGKKVGKGTLKQAIDAGKFTSNDVAFLMGEAGAKVEKEAAQTA